MTTRNLFQKMMKERRKYPAHSAEWEWRTRAARALAQMIQGKPSKEWTQ